nr:hypothetical protein [Tanacetum cinerariifolium]
MAILDGGDDEVELTDEEFFDPDDKILIHNKEVVEIFRIKTNIFDFETPLCKTFVEFNYLLKVDTELFTHDIERTKTYEDYINEQNNKLDEPWSKNRVPHEICDHICEPFCFKNAEAKFPTCNSNKDGFCNDGELPDDVDINTLTIKQYMAWVQEDIRPGVVKPKINNDIEFEINRNFMRDQVSILAKDKGFGQEIHQSEEPKALYGVTSPKDYVVTYSNEEMSHHTLYGVKCLQDYAATLKYTRYDASDSALRHEAVNEEMDDSLKRAATTATSLDTEQDRETTTTTQALEIDSLKRRVKKLERRKRSRTHGLKRLYKVGLSPRVESSAYEGLGKEDASKQGRIADIDANKDITLVSTHDEQMFDADQDLDGEEVFVTQIDEKVVVKKVDAAQIQVTTAATTPTISIDKATLAQALAEKEEQTTNTSSTKKIMCTYLKNMERKKLTDLKNKSFDFIHKLFDRAFKRVNTFVDYGTELVEESSKKAKAEITQEGSLKRAGDKLEQERSKKQKVEDDKESEELKNV